jgi:hypothetical protein
MERLERNVSLKVETASSRSQTEKLTVEDEDAEKVLYVLEFSKTSWKDGSTDRMERVERIERMVKDEDTLVTETASSLSPIDPQPAEELAQAEGGNEEALAIVALPETRSSGVWAISVSEAVSEASPDWLRSAMSSRSSTGIS